MPTRTVDDPAYAYRSAACRIGTHLVCAESSPAMAPADVPVIYEACGCPCHAERDRSGIKAVAQ
ncbi:hypothetical protein ACFW2X_32400 [Streptomyces antibioticus]|uniref:hypothetical protein n=1 Tax=Streptomyces antibioticus TaxID=1890 RepID=UPI0036AF7551